MVDVLAFLSSPTAFILSIAIMVFMIKDRMGTGTVGYFDHLGFPITLTFIQPYTTMILEFILFGAVMILAVPFLLQLGFSAFLILVAAIAYFAQKHLGWPLEQSLAVGILAVLVIGGTF